MFYILVYEPNLQRKKQIHLCLRKTIFEYNLVNDVIWLESIPSEESIRKYFPEVQLALLSLEDQNCRRLSEALYRHNSECRIIFYSGTQDEVINLLHTRPIGFCPCSKKILEEDELMHTLKMVFSELSSTTYVVSLENKNGLYLLPKSQILYFQSDLKNVNVYSLGMPVISLSRKLSNLQKDLCTGSHARDFIRCHQSYLVNRDNISFLDKSGHKLILSNGEELPVSDSRYNEVCQLCHSLPKNDC